MKLCHCGSGLPRHELLDAAGVFCGFVCESCEDEHRKKFNPRIFEDWYDADQPDVYWPEKPTEDKLTIVSAVTDDGLDGYFSPLDSLFLGRGEEIDIAEMEASDDAYEIFLIVRNALGYNPEAFSIE